jgi:hypothetical protein
VAEDIRLVWNETLADSARLSVTQRIPGEQVRVTITRSATQSDNPPEMGLQVWVLKSNGTTLPRERTSDSHPVTFWTAGNGSMVGSTFFAFEPVDRADLAAVVVSVNGALFVRPIPQNPPANQSP